jgi:DNA-binding CsgD family transcriptional regulator
MINPSNSNQRPSPYFMRASRTFLRGSSSFLRACHLARENDRLRAQRRRLQSAVIPASTVSAGEPAAPATAPAPSLGASARRGSFRTKPVLPRRLQETLDLLLAGASEKQAAEKLEISYHTVHEYVKILYKRFHVASRSQLLALFVQRDTVAVPHAAVSTEASIPKLNSPRQPNGNESDDEASERSAPGLDANWCPPAEPDTFSNIYSK